ncbi:MAG TPA: hypothetical protein VG755_12685 [Nannocystaceae bacterium]|nr:hypothetical protein [Nannocystaceae bacterium]
MSSRRVGAVILFAALAAACSADSSNEGSSDDSSGAADESSSGGASATGTVTLTFSVSNGVRMGPTLMDPLMGGIYGDLYLTADVALTGPVDGAVPITSVAVEGVDLTTAETTTQSWTSEPLPPDSYTFLGMFDVDGNFEATHNPEMGDPVTLTNQDFDVVADQDTPFLVTFELVYG